MNNLLEYRFSGRLAIALQETGRSEAQKSASERLRGLRELPDGERARVTKQLALDIRQLPTSTARVNLATGLAILATEGDFGSDTLQEVTTTLAEALRAQPEGNKKLSVSPYMTLAQLSYYEEMKVSLDAPQLAEAIAQLKAEDRQREKIDFTLTDLQGTAWTLKALRGKVVMVNFWATWCPPCCKELPDLEILYNRFKEKGFLILGITDEDAAGVKPFVAKNKMTYPILTDPGRKVTNSFLVRGIPRSLIYDRNGKLAAQAIDMRTQKQFLSLLARVGLK